MLISKSKCRIRAWFLESWRLGWFRQRKLCPVFPRMWDDWNEWQLQKETVKASTHSWYCLGLSRTYHHWNRPVLLRTCSKYKHILHTYCKHTTKQYVIRIAVCASIGMYVHASDFQRALCCPAWSSMHLLVVIPVHMCRYKNLGREYICRYLHVCAWVFGYTCCNFDYKCMKHINIRICMYNMVYKCILSVLLLQIHAHMYLHSSACICIQWLLHVKVSRTPARGRSTLAALSLRQVRRAGSADSQIYSDQVRSTGQQQAAAWTGATVLHAELAAEVHWGCWLAFVYEETTPSLQRNNDNDVQNNNSSWSNGRQRLKILRSMPTAG